MVVCPQKKILHFGEQSERGRFISFCRPVPRHLSATRWARVLARGYVLRGPSGLRRSGQEDPLQASAWRDDFSGLQWSEMMPASQDFRRKGYVLPKASTAAAAAALAAHRGRSSSIRSTSCSSRNGHAVRSPKPPGAPPSGLFGKDAAPRFRLPAWPSCPVYWNVL